MTTTNETIYDHLTPILRNGQPCHDDDNTTFIMTALSIGILGSVIGIPTVGKHVHQAEKEHLFLMLIFFGSDSYLNEDTLFTCHVVFDVKVI